MNRRKFLQGSAAGILSTAVGCGYFSRPQQVPAPPQELVVPLEETAKTAIELGRFLADVPFLPIKMAGIVLVLGGKAGVF